MRQRNPKGRYVEGEIGKGNTHTKPLQVSLELYIICYTFSVCVCVYASSFATAIVLLSKLSGRERNLNVYLTWLWLIPNRAYSTFVTLSVPVCIFYSPCFIFSILCSETARRTIHHFLVEGESHHLPPTAGSLEKTNLFLFFMHIQ